MFVCVFLFCSLVYETERNWAMNNLKLALFYIIDFSPYIVVHRISDLFIHVRHVHVHEKWVRSLLATDKTKWTAICNNAKIWRVNDIAYYLTWINSFKLVLRHAHIGHEQNRQRREYVNQITWAYFFSLKEIIYSSSCSFLHSFVWNLNWPILNFLVPCDHDIQHIISVLLCIFRSFALSLHSQWYYTLESTCYGFIVCVFRKHFHVIAWQEWIGKRFAMIWKKIDEISFTASGQNLFRPRKNEKKSPTTKRGITEHCCCPYLREKLFMLRALYTRPNVM